jgi:hypothetical protein
MVSSLSPTPSQDFQVHPVLQSPDNRCHQFLSLSRQVLCTLITHLNKARQDDDPVEAPPLSLTKDSPAKRKPARLREDQDAGVGGRFHDVGQVLASGLEIVRVYGPRCECRAEKVSCGRDMGIPHGEVGAIVFGTGTEIGG